MKSPPGPPGGLFIICCRDIRGTLGQRYVYFCPHCGKTLGVSLRRGFWMG